MSESVNTEAVPASVGRMLDDEAPVASSEQPALYRVDPLSKIPVSKKYGKLWEGRVRSALSARQLMEEGWDEAIRYYNNSQQEHREGADGRGGNRYFAKRRNPNWSETENIVYANTSAIIPALYMKNPEVEFTTQVEDQKEFVQRVEKLVNALAGRRHAPGLNLKMHAKQAVLSAELCNLGWLEYGYTERKDSLTEAQSTLEALGKELESAKDIKTIKQIEGKLMAVEEELTVAQPAGPWVRYHAPQNIVCGDCSMPDFSDAPWIAVRCFYPTDYLNAKYGDKQEDGSVKSLYAPSHVLCGGSDSTDDVQNFKLFKEGDEAQAYGYGNKMQLQKAQRTMCWRIWDRTSRRVFLYADNDFTWPIWVEADPYGLPDFMPFRAFYFNTSPIGPYARSNVTYYLDQQDGINEIHDEWRRARLDAKENILYDDMFDRDTVEKWLKGAGPSAHGVKVPEGKQLKDMIMPKPNALMAAMPLFDPQRLLQSVDRIGGVSEAMRGAQFKTNTTNKAIESYQTSTSVRLDAKIDAIEDAIGEVLYGIGFLCAQFMTQDEVKNILGAEIAEAWQNIPAADLRGIFNVQTVGGSTQKPTSEAKKRQALEVGKILTQFAQFAPAEVIEITLTLFDEAFDEVTLPENVFDRVKEAAQVALRRGNSDAGPGGAGGGGGAPPAEGGGGDQLAQIAQVVDSMPPEAKVALGNALAKGVPIAEALPTIMQALQQSAPQ